MLGERPFRGQLFVCGDDACFYVVADASVQVFIKAVRAALIEGIRKNGFAPCRFTEDPRAFDMLGFERVVTLGPLDRFVVALRSGVFPTLDMFGVSHPKSDSALVLI